MYMKNQRHTISITQANIDYDQRVAPLFPPSLLNRCGWKIQQFYIFQQTVNERVVRAESQTLSALHVLQVLT